MIDPINQEHEEVLNFAHSLPSGLTKEQIYVRIHERAKSAASADQAEGVVPADARDAARYRWLRDPKTNAANVLDKRTGWHEYDEGTRTGGYGIYEYRAGEELDSAIDAAMGASPAVQQPAEQAAPVAESQPAAANPYSDYRATYWQAGFDGKDICSTTRGPALAAYSDGLKSRVAPQAPVPAASEGWIAVEEMNEQNAPKDGEQVLTCGLMFEEDGRGHWVEAAFYRAPSRFFDYTDDEHEDHYQPTHYRGMLPLPAAPATSDKAEG